MLPLVLVQQGNRANERQILHVITPGACPSGRQSQDGGHRGWRQHRMHQALGVLMQRDYCRRESCGEKTVDGLALRLAVVNGTGLFSLLVDGQHYCSGSVVPRRCLTAVVV